jgi:hypothetical protein
MNDSKLQEIYNQYGSVTSESALYKSNQTKNITLGDWNEFVKLLQTRSEDVKRLYKSLIPEIDSELSLCLRKKQTSFELDYVDNAGNVIAKLNFPTILEDSTVATESYVATSLTEGLDKKVDKITSDGLKIYATNPDGYVPVSNTPFDGRIPIYNSNARIKTSLPEETADATNKEYVDNNFVSKDHDGNVEISGNLTVNGEITFVDTDQLTSDNPVAAVNTGYLDADAAEPPGEVTGIVAITGSKDDSNKHPAFGFLYHKYYGPVLVRGHYSDGIFSIDGNYSENIAVKRGEVTSGRFTYFDENNILRSSETSIDYLADMSAAVDKISEIQNEYIGSYRG